MIDESYNAIKSDFITALRIIVHEGRHAESALDGYQAIEAAARFRPEIVLLDIGMPELDGYETARRIRQI